MQQYTVIENNIVVNIVVGEIPVKGGQQLVLIESDDYCEESYSDGLVVRRFPTLGDTFLPGNKNKRYKRER